MSADSQSVRIAMIFDDGPLPGQTERLLAILGRERVQATFGAIGRNVADNASAARAVVAAGHEIANHSFSHRHPMDLDDSTLTAEIVDAQKIITAATGVAPRWHWPPFLELDARLAAITARAGIAVYQPPRLVVSEDYRPEVSAAEIRRNATVGVVDRTVILFHEWRNETLDELPAIVAALRRQRAVFVTFSELADSADPAPSA
ncbi:MAG TPA: polysaccharide deacetylase family protein [Opitutus sp.]|nr:polysaccharide deacetylase family protein [Opitutus sp.]